MKIIFLFNFHVFLVFSSQINAILSVCDSKLYCYGDLLHKVQMSHIFNDSKTYVDMPTKLSENLVLENFEKLNLNPSKTEIANFLKENFHSVGYDLIQTEPTDWIPNPSYLDLLNKNETSLIQLGEKLNMEWKNLLRKFDHTKLCIDCASSAIETNNSFVVPGGRFIEYYYWDTYFVIEALITSQMFSTSKGIIGNFLDIVKHQGFVPNGARVYYLNRSQPPLLIQMFYAYYSATNDHRFLLDSIDLLDQEYDYWMKNKFVVYQKNEKAYVLNSYNVTSSIPRPESYREDFLNANQGSNPTGYYSNVMSAAESGWDFSSRWFENPQDIKTISITDIIPVDLNAIMFRNEFILSDLHRILNNTYKSLEYELAMKRREEAINEVLWDENIETWADLNIHTNRLHTNFLYVTDLSPLWFGVTPKSDPNIILKRYDSLLMSHISGTFVFNLE